MKAARAKRPSVVRWLFRWGLRLGLTFVLLSFLLIGGLRFVNPPGSAFMMARMQQARSDGQKTFRLKRTWKPLSAISPALPVAVIAAEDQRFLSHHGFDLVEIKNALKDAEDGRGRGASTISQQVAKNLFLWSGRSYLRKGLEVWCTGLIELTWPKRRIIEVYLNIAEFGDGVYGVEAAAQQYFSVPASKITEAQAARMAAVLPNPKKLRLDQPSAYVLRRQQWIERQMRQLGGTTLGARIEQGSAKSQ